MLSPELQIVEWLCKKG